MLYHQHSARHLMARVLVIDDDRALDTALLGLLQQIGKHEARHVGDAAAVASIDMVVEAMKLGADNFVVKPIDPPRLLALIGKGLGQGAGTHRCDRGAHRMNVVGKEWLLVWCVATAACGRIGFDPLAGLDGSPMLSCTDLSSICGPSGTSSCCGSSLVSGGMFYRSFDYGTDNVFTDTTNPAIVSDFRLDTYEVTVGRFRQFVNAGMGTQANPPLAGVGARTLNGVASQGGWDPTWNGTLTADTAAFIAALNCAGGESWTDTPGPNEALPMSCITWYEAFAFCALDGGFLPTEAEWNYAAVGGGEQRAYPWSNPASSLTIDCSYLNYYDGVANCGTVNRVGSESPKGDGKYGQADLGGNLWEWTLDYYQSLYGNPCNDCAYLSATAFRVTRGGAFVSPALQARGANRGALTPGRNGSVSVRCARTP
jgi:formylglycine-generating enzyme required for sulfatase activity